MISTYPDLELQVSCNFLLSNFIFLFLVALYLALAEPADQNHKITYPSFSNLKSLIKLENHQKTFVEAEAHKISALFVTPTLVYERTN